MTLLYSVAWLLVIGLMLIGSPSVRGDDVGGLSGEAAEEEDDVTQLRHHRRHHHRHQQQQQANDSVIERQQWINRQRLSLTLAEPQRTTFIAPTYRPRAVGLCTGWVKKVGPQTYDHNSVKS